MRLSDCIGNSSSRLYHDIDMDLYWDMEIRLYNEILISFYIREVLSNRCIDNFLIMADISAYNIMMGEIHMKFI
jgi:hypothetical protein